ncbi:MAG: zf-HC2 domain-containing protein [Planctomycetota bacterium]|nr:zf-HC2 domain-containing protein [Planctomycetota bacterium]
MNCEDLKPLMMALLDGELPPEQREKLESHLATCESCRQELAEFIAMKEKLAMVKFREPSDDELDRYWKSIYNRVERGMGWVLFSLGAIILLCYGSFKLIEEIIRDPKIALILKIGVVALIFGVVILFVSLLRERLAVRKADMYSKEIKR